MSETINNPNSRPFRLDEVLTAVSGTNFLNTENDKDPNAFTRRMGGLFGYMTGSKQAETFQLPRMADEVTPALLAAHPEIAAVVQDMPPDPAADATPAEEARLEAAHQAWYNRVKAEYADRMGEMVGVAPLPKDQQGELNPQVEFAMMGGDTITDQADLLPLMLARPEAAPIPAPVARDVGEVAVAPELSPEAASFQYPPKLTLVKPEAPFAPGSYADKFAQTGVSFGFDTQPTPPPDRSAQIAAELANRPQFSQPDSIANRAA